MSAMPDRGELGEQATGFLVGLLIFLVAIGFLIYQFPQIVTVPWEVFKRVEVKVMAPAMRVIETGAIKAGLPRDVIVRIDHVRRSYSALEKVFAHRPVGTVKLGSMARAESALYPASGVFYAVIMLAIMWPLRKRGRYGARRLDMEDLIRQETKIWRHNRWLIKYNPAKESPDLTKGRARVQYMPESFVREQGIVHLRDEEGGEPYWVFDRAKAYEVMRSHMGPPWRGADRMKPHRRWLLAAFMLAANRKYEDCIEFLGDLGEVYADERSRSEVEARAREIIKQYGDTEASRPAMKEHAWDLTVMLRMLEAGRKYGKISPSMFLWLKIVEQDLEAWWPLHNLGIPNAGIEALPVIAHYRVELRTMREGGVKSPEFEYAFPRIEEHVLPRLNKFHVPTKKELRQKRKQRLRKRTDENGEQKEDKTGVNDERQAV